ncbi:MAG: fatty acid desaturase [Pyrinomonadaceae bacterium]
MQKITEIKPLRMGPNWRNIIFLSSFHLLSILVFFTFSWTNLAVMLILNWVVGGLGVGLGYHRLMTHRGFKTPKWLEYILVMFGTMSVQDAPTKWVATHRMHHAFVETDKDPHSTNSGFWWAQIGWVVWGPSQDHDAATLKRWVPDMLKDPVHVWISRLYMLPITLSAVLLWAIGGWKMVLWGVCVRVVFGWHTTWFVNSLSHMFGKRTYDTEDLSTNNWFVALLTFGEGWHNNHHAFPVSARHGLKWYQFDLNWITIRAFEKLGWARDIKVYGENAAAVELRRAA